MQKVVRKVLRAVADYDPDYYDMHDDPNEAWFARLYLERVRQHAAAASLRAKTTVLDAGCQTGRLLIPLAKDGFEATGIDTSGFALRRARKHAAAAGVRVSLVRGDLAQVLEAHPNQQYDLVLCTEVLYQNRNYRRMLGLLAEAVKPGGLLCVSHRPQFYYLLDALRRRDTAAMQLVLSASEGCVEGPKRGYYNWQTEELLRQMYKGLGLEWIAMYPIDRFAWLSGIAPSQLTEEQRDLLLRMELESSGEPGTCGRYLFVIARKPADA